MPRRDVPYPTGGSIICRIKEELRALWARAGSCINKINNITPDGDGKFQINAGAGIVVSPDGNGIEISATSVSYTGIDPIVVDNDTLEISAPTVAVQDDLAAKADKATSLAGYGITDGVTTNTAQDITAEKSFSANIVTKAPTGTVRDIVNLNTTTNVRSGMVRYDSGSSINKSTLFAFKPGDASLGNSANIQVENNGTDKYVTASYRAYNSANVNDVVTIGSLASNPSVIHATGNETVGGIKTFTSNIIERGSSPSLALYSTNISSSSVPDTSVAVRIFDNNDTQVGTFEQRFFGTDQSWVRILTYHVGNGTDRAELRVTFEGTTAKLVLLKRLNGTETSTTIATL